MDHVDKRSNEDYLVCDLCMGTGTAGVSALNTYKARFLGFESDNAVFEVFFFFTHLHSHIF